MAKRRKFSAEFKAKVALEEMIRRKVESGLYNNASEVVREALRLMGHHDRLYQLRLERLRAAVETGEASGPAEGYTFEGLLAELDEEAGSRSR